MDPHDGETCEQTEERLDEATGELNEISMWLARRGVSVRQADGTWDYIAALQRLIGKPID